MSLILFLLLQAANGATLQLPDWAVSTVGVVGDAARSGTIPVLGLAALTGRGVLDAIRARQAPPPAVLAMRIGPVPAPGGPLYLGCAEVDVFRDGARKVATMRAREGMVRFRDGALVEGRESLLDGVLGTEIRERVFGTTRPLEVVEEQILKAPGEHYLCVLVRETA